MQRKVKIDIKHISVEVNECQTLWNVKNYFGFVTKPDFGMKSVNRNETKWTK